MKDPSPCWFMRPVVSAKSLHDRGVVILLASCVRNARRCVLCQLCDGNWTSLPNLENQTTHACVLFSNWGVHERRVGLLGFHLQIDRPPSSANLGGHAITIMSEPCSGVEAHSVPSMPNKLFPASTRLRSSCQQQSRFDLPKLEVL